MARKNGTSRRKFLRHLGTAAVALPLVNILRFPRAGAATPVAPLRLLQLWSPFHVPEIFYHPQNATGGFATAGSTFNLSFANSTLAPLAPYQSKLLIFRGLCYGGGPNSHVSNGTCFTGASSSENASSMAQTAGTSIDQYLFSRMGQAGSPGPIVGGFMAYDFADHLFDFTTSWNAGSAQGMSGNPSDILKSFFANFAPPSSGSAPTGPAPATLRRQKSLAVAQQGLNALVAQLPAGSPSLPRLQQHQTSLASLIASVSGTGTSTANLASCAVPTAASIANIPSGTLDYTKTAADISSFSTLITEAFACDITRFASLKLSSEDDPSCGIVPSIPGLTDFTGNWHADITHTTTDSASNASDVKMATYRTYFTSLMAQIMKQLSATADPYSPSQSLFDNTVILIGSEGSIQVPNGDQHNNGTEDQPFLVAGGCGGAFEMGRLIDVRSMGTVLKAPGIAHNALLTNIVNAFEKNQQAFNPSYTPKILTQYGDYAFPVSATTWLSS